MGSEVYHNLKAVIKEKYGEHLGATGWAQDASVGWVGGWVGGGLVGVSPLDTGLRLECTATWAGMLYKRFLSVSAVAAHKYSNT
jgi:hypothetical protein